MDDSILNSVKKVLGLDADYTEFDVDILMHINSTFGTLHDLGVGPIEGFSIEDATTTWGNFLQGDARFNRVKTYVCLKVRLLFDPPTTAHLLTAVKEQIAELEWRISVVREGDISGYVITPII